MLFNCLGGFVGDATKDWMEAQVGMRNIVHEELPDEDTNIFYDPDSMKKKNQ